MLFLPPASSRFIRLHGPYISEQESARLASFLRKQGKPIYDETITAEEKSRGRRHRVREGRPLRRGRAHRRAERPGVDLVPAAPAADRLQPRRAAGGHDGNGRPRLARPPAARRARCSSTRTTSTKWTRSCGSAETLAHAPTHACSPSPSLAGCRPRRSAAQTTPKVMYARAQGREQAARKALDAGRPADGVAQGRRARRGAATKPSSRRYPAQRLQRQRAVAGRHAVGVAATRGYRVEMRSRTTPSGC